MSDSYNLSDLQHNRLWSGRSSETKDIVLELSVWNGSTSLSVRDNSKPGAPLFRMSIPRDFAISLRNTYAHLLSQPAGTKYAIPFEEWDNATRTPKPVATLIPGIDAKGTPYFGLTCPAGTYKFPLRLGLRFNMTEANIPESIIHTSATQAFTEALTFDTVVAARLSSRKRQNNGGGGGGYNRGGHGGGNRNGGGGNRNSATGDDDFVL